MSANEAVPVHNDDSKPKPTNLIQINISTQI